MPIRRVGTQRREEVDLVALMRQGDDTAIRNVIQANNRRLFRIARSVLKNDGDAEDAVQEAYVHAFTHLDHFRGEASFSTWLTRIVLNEALGRLRRRRPTMALSDVTGTGGEVVPFPLSATQPDPERSMAQRQISRLLERAIDALPDPFRVVLVARVLEEMTVEETAELFGLRPETVKTRLHRARQMLRKDIEQQVGPLLADAFPFEGMRCRRMTDAVIGRLANLT